MLPMQTAAPLDLKRVFAEALTKRLRRHVWLEMHANQLLDGAAGEPRWLGRAPWLRGSKPLQQMRPRGWLGRPA